ncbi:MAG: PIN domain-containing protein [Ignavibacteriaceae bacterium]
MTEDLTIDSSVIISSIITSEVTHLKALEIITSVIEKKQPVHFLFSVLVEVSGAIKLRTRSALVANEVRNRLLNIPNIKFYELTAERSEKACLISIELGLRGMDAIIVQLSNELNTKLITFDAEILKKLGN